MNARFAAALAPLLRPDDIIWVHDYHFFPFASELRKLGVRNRIGFFLHIPFPAPEVLSVLPSYRAILANLADYDLVGFQTKSDLRSFLSGIADEADGSIAEDASFARLRPPFARRRVSDRHRHRRLRCTGGRRRTKPSSNASAPA